MQHLKTERLLCGWQVASAKSRHFSACQFHATTWQKTIAYSERERERVWITAILKHLKLQPTQLALKHFESIGPAREKGWVS